FRRQLLDREGLAASRRSEYGKGQRPMLMQVAAVRSNQIANRIEPLDLVAVHGQVVPVAAFGNRQQRRIQSAQADVDTLGEYIIQPAADRVAQQIGLRR